MVSKYERMASNRVLRRLKKNTLIEVTVEDNCMINKIMRREEVYKEKPSILRTVGYYQGHNAEYLYLSTDFIDSDDDTGTFLIYLRRYITSIRVIGGDRDEC